MLTISASILISLDVWPPDREKKKTVLLMRDTNPLTGYTDPKRFTVFIPSTQLIVKQQKTRDVSSSALSSKPQKVMGDGENVL